MCTGDTVVLDLDFLFPLTTHSSLRALATRYYCVYRSTSSYCSTTKVYYVLQCYACCPEATLTGAGRRGLDSARVRQPLCAYIENPPLRGRQKTYSPSSWNLVDLASHFLPLFYFLLSFSSPSPSSS